MAANKIKPILIYALLEWTLIILLLLNSVFTYLIIKFAQYFHLNPPCFACARIDRFRYHLCELHSKEVSQLRLCSNHKKLAEFGNMCENCSSPDPGFKKETKSFVFSMVERIDVVHGDGEGDVDLKCACCGSSYVDDHHEIESRDHESEDVDCEIETGEHEIESREHEIEDADDGIETGEYEIENREQSDEEIETGEHEIEVTRDSKCIEADLIQFENGEDLNSQDLKFFTDYNGDQLFPFELADPKNEEHPKSFEDEDHEFGDFQKAQTNSHENLIDFGDENVVLKSLNEEQQEDDSDSHSVDEGDNVSIGTQIPVLDLSDEIKHEEPSTISYDLLTDIEKDSKNGDGENAGGLKNLSVKIKETEEEQAPYTPSGLHSPNPFHKRWLSPKTKDSWTEESFDGSVISEPDGGDPVSTAEKLKSALKVEQKALRDLYLELEEERNASAVAANETMAMITRLQEEKAAMQMEALQYRRMMEEQSEYDQEALQLLNEVMMKKEKELELYRKKVSDYEEKEKKKTSSASWSRSEDDEGSSVDLHHVAEDENALHGDQEIQHPHTPVDSVLDFESTLANFEEERVSILEQLRFLEEKLVALSEEEDRQFANVRVIEDHYEETNNIGFSGQVTEVTTTNGFVRNGKQAMGKQLLPLFDAISIGAEDDVTVRNGYENGFYPIKFEDTAVMRFELEKKRIDMEEEIDQLYGRLQAFEADREFLKHCIGSMNKGGKGVEVLQEILHHLRNLRDVNLRAKSYTENVLL